MKYSNRVSMAAIFIAVSVFTGACGSKTTATGTGPGGGGGGVFVGGPTPGPTPTPGPVYPVAIKRDFFIKGYNSGATPTNANFGTVAAPISVITVNTDDHLVIRAVAKARDKLTGISNNTSQGYSCMRYQINIKVTNDPQDPGYNFQTSILKATAPNAAQNPFCSNAVLYEDIGKNGEIDAIIMNRGPLLDGNGNPVLDGMGNPVPAPVKVTITEAENEWRCINVNAIMTDQFGFPAWYYNPCRAPSPYPFIGSGAVSASTTSLYNTHTAGGAIWLETNGTQLPPAPTTTQ